MNTEELVVAWTARLAIVLYVLALASRVLRWRIAISRGLWTAGCAVYLLHVGCAFGFVHHWSHTAAVAATARQTAQAIGLDWGGGLYVNYIFTLVWLADAVWWWLSPSSYLARSCFTEWAIDMFMAFIAFNATVVFATGVSRYLGITSCLVLAVLWIRRRQVVAR